MCNAVLLPFVVNKDYQYMQQILKYSVNIPISRFHGRDADREMDGFP